MVFVKKMAILNFCSAKQDDKKVFRIVLVKRECFLDTKNNVLKKSKNSTFFKGVSPWFLSKKGNFQLLVFFSKINLKSLLRIILDRKECFPENKN